MDTAVLQDADWCVDAVSASMQSTVGEYVAVMCATLCSAVLARKGWHSACREVLCIVQLFCSV